mmetsp:Transcript_18800/g.51497  ORF Transcript_18800/g.51497 Transcript_18800/m.51497 type:complete len:111 (+) Transcript_18800:630-962(+)
MTQIDRNPSNRHNTNSMNTHATTSIPSHAAMTLNHKYPCDVVSETSRKKIRSTARFIKPPCQEISRPMIQVHRYHAVTPTTGSLEEEHGNQTTESTNFLWPKSPTMDNHP